MKYRVLIFIIFLFLGCEQSTSPSSYQNYFPLDVGNSWTLEHGLKISTLEYTISDMTEIGGKNYFTFGYADFDNKLVFQDDDGNIFQRIDDEDRLWFDFTRKDNETYTFYDADSTLALYTVKVLKDQTVRTKMRTFNNCIMFYFDNPEQENEEYWFVFAQDVGLVVTGNTAQGDWGLVNYQLN